jgi:hypothetical protein
MLGQQIFQTLTDTENDMIAIDMNKAKEIWKDYLRHDRAPILEKLDLEFIRALESNNTEEQDKIKKTKQDLRDVTADPRISKASSPEELKSLKLVDEIIKFIK